MTATAPSALGEWAAAGEAIAIAALIWAAVAALNAYRSFGARMDRLNRKIGRNR